MYKRQARALDVSEKDIKTYQTEFKTFLLKSAVTETMNDAIHDINSKHKYKIEGVVGESLIVETFADLEVDVNRPNIVKSGRHEFIYEDPDSFSKELAKHIDAKIFENIEPVVDWSVAVTSVSINKRSRKGHADIIIKFWHIT